MTDQPTNQAPPKQQFRCPGCRSVEVQIGEQWTSWTFFDPGTYEVRDGSLAVPFGSGHSEPEGPTGRYRAWCGDCGYGWTPRRKIEFVDRLSNG